MLKRQGDGGRDESGESERDSAHGRRRVEGDAASEDERETESVGAGVDKRR